MRSVISPYKFLVKISFRVALVKDVLKTMTTILLKTDRPVKKTVVFQKHRDRFMIKRCLQLGLSILLKHVLSFTMFAA